MEQTRTTPTAKSYYAGRYTAGISLIICGTLYIVSLFTNALDLGFVLKLWPIILIGMGTEMLICAIRSKGERIHYDWLSVLLMLLLSGCAMLLLLMKYLAILLPNLF